jgi:ABC-type phosphate/phosphonate transport system ATPase subunit
MDRGAARDKAADWVRRVGLAGFEHHYPHQLSGGMRKRVALAQTFINEPAILLMDEPFSALDVQTRAMMQEELLGLWSERDRAAVFTVLEQFEIGNLAARRAETLSGGQQQRVAIARALAQEPRIILADEPTASLDPRSAIIVMEALKRINRDYGISVICNLHSLDIARSYCQRLIGMSAGRVVCDCTPAELTDAVARDLYGMEADEALGAPAPDGASDPVSDATWQPALQAA